MRCPECSGDLDRLVASIPTNPGYNYYCNVCECGWLLIKVNVDNYGKERP